MTATYASQCVTPGEERSNHHNIATSTSSTSAPDISRIVPPRA